MEAKKRVKILANKLTQKRCQNGHEHKITCICTNPSCEKRFLCLSCILEDSSHFNSHKSYIFEITEYLNSNMIEGMEKFSQELPKKQSQLDLLEELQTDFSSSITEIFDDIDHDYNNFKTKIIQAIDKARDNLKTKFQDEINRRKDKIDLLKGDIKKIRDIEELKIEKEKSLNFVLDELGDNPNVSNEFYFLLYNFVNLDKAELKNLKNIISDVEDYQRLYKSKKFESYGKLFQEYQKNSKKDNEVLGKIVQEFTDNKRKNQINKTFKERIDNVFKSEISANNIIKFEIDNEDISKVHQDVKKINQERKKRVGTKKVENDLRINPKVYEKDPKLKEVLLNPLVQSLIRNHNEESLGDLLLKNVEKKEKRQAEFLLLQKQAKELKTQNRRLSISERINMKNGYQNLPKKPINWPNSQANRRQAPPAFNGHQNNIQMKFGQPRSNQSRSRQPPAQLSNLQIRSQANPIQRFQGGKIQPGYEYYKNKNEILFQQQESDKFPHERLLNSKNPYLKNQHNLNYARGRRQIPKSQPPERSYLGKRKQFLVQDSFDDFKIRKKKKLTRVEEMKDRYNRELIELSNKKQSSVNSITKILQKKQLLQNQKMKKKTRRFTETASKNTTKEKKKQAASILEPLDQNMFQTNRKVGRRDPIVKNIAKLTKSAVKPPCKETGYVFTVSRSFGRMKSQDYSDDLLRKGQVFIFTGHSESDFIQADLSDGAKIVRKLVIEPPQVKSDMEENKKKINGAVIQILNRKGEWVNTSSVKFGKSNRAEIPIGQEVRSLRLVHGPNMPKSASLGIGKLLIL